MQNGHLIEASTLKISAFLKNLILGRGFGSVIRHHYLKNQPFSVGFFRLFPQCLRGFRAWPCERRPCEGGIFAPTDVSLFSVFSGGYVSVLEAISFAGAGCDALTAFPAAYTQDMHRGKSAQPGSLRVRAGCSASAHGAFFISLLAQCCCGHASFRYH